MIVARALYRPFCENEIEAIKRALLCVRFFCSVESRSVSSMHIPRAHKIQNKAVVVFAVPGFPVSTEKGNQRLE